MFSLNQTTKRANEIQINDKLIFCFALSEDLLFYNEVTEIKFDSEKSLIGIRFDEQINFLWYEQEQIVGQVAL